MNKFSNILINWYNENKRELPWRATNDPYKIWISEIILQQTRVAQGYAYYLRFIERFPDVKSLAKAHEDEVLKYWQGLGYYSRARNLHAAAKSVHEKFPETYQEVRAMKGVGDYTAAAVCSIAYNLPHAVVDGNVYRVLARYFGIDTPIDSTEGKKFFASLADELLNKEQAGIYNQAIMDFGAIQCTPLSPNCLFCPFSDSCVARKSGLISKLPVKQNKTKTRNRYFNYFFVKMGAYTFLHKRGKHDIWEGLFELPLLEMDNEVDAAELFASQEFKELLPSELMDGCSVSVLQKNVKHVLSHQVIMANFYEILLPESSKAFEYYQKVLIEDIKRYAVPRLIESFLEKRVLK